MKSFPGFLSELQEQLENLPVDCIERVNRDGGLEIADFLDLVSKPRDYTVVSPEAPTECNLIKHEHIELDSFWTGREALVSGKAAHAVICHENLLSELPASNISQLGMILMRLSWVKEVWILVDPSHEDAVRKICESVGSKAALIFSYQTFLLRADNLLEIRESCPVLRPCGSGDLISSIKNSEIYNDFLSHGGEYIVACSKENLLGAKPSVLGHHILSKNNVTCEVTEKLDGDDRPLLCMHGGFEQLVEMHRFSSFADSEDLNLAYSGTTIFNCSLDFDSFKWKWHRRKVVQDKKSVVFFERTLCDLTANFQSNFVHTSRRYTG
jgi:hypothetical protein